MSRVHIVKTGETLQKIAIIYYGDSSKNTRIRQANPQIANPDVIIPGQNIVIPDLPERKSGPTAPAPEQIEVTPETVDEETGLSDEVAILIDGEPFKLWQNVEINFSFDTIGDEFSMSTPWYPEIERYRKVFKPNTYREIALYLGGQKELTGEIVVPATTSQSSEAMLTISGYSLPGRLAKVNPSPSSWPLEFSGLDLFQIAEQLSLPYGIKVIGEGDPGPKFVKSDKIAMEPDQKIYDFLIDLARQRGFVLSSNEYGFMLIHKTTEDPAEVAIIDGQWPFISGSTSFDGDARYSDVTAIGTNNTKGAGQKLTISDPELKRNGINRSLIYKASDTNAGNLKEAAISKLGRDIANSFTLSVTVEGLYRSDKKLWKDNQKVIYQSDRNMIYKETEFLIRDAKLSKNKDSNETNLTLVFPECYNGEIREEFPWD